MHMNTFLFKYGEYFLIMVSWKAVTYSTFLCSCKWCADWSCFKKMATRMLSRKKEATNTFIKKRITYNVGPQKEVRKVLKAHIGQQLSCLRPPSQLMHQQHRHDGFGERVEGRVAIIELLLEGVGGVTLLPQGALVVTSIRAQSDLSGGACVGHLTWLISHTIYLAIFAHP